MVLPDSHQHLLMVSFLTFLSSASPLLTLSQGFQYQGQAQVSLEFGWEMG